MNRQNYYKGQRVKAVDMNALQDYTDKSQASLVASLLGYGVVNGFNMSHLEGHILEVSAGLAFNLAGERLPLASGRQVNLVDLKPTTGDRTIKLGIVLSYEKTEATTDFLGNTVYTKWTPTVEFITEESLDAGILELAEIKINPLSVVEIINTKPTFNTLPDVETMLLYQIKSLARKTSAFSSVDGLAEILSNDKIILQSPMIDMITPMLQINGTPYMEIGQNSNGTYIKWENGLLICLGSKINVNNVSSYNVTYSFSIQFHNIIFVKASISSGGYSDVKWVSGGESNITGNGFIHSFGSSTSSDVSVIYNAFSWYVAIGFHKDPIPATLAFPITGTPALTISNTTKTKFQQSLFEPCLTFDTSIATETATLLFPLDKNITVFEPKMGKLDIINESTDERFSANYEFKRSMDLANQLILILSGDFEADTSYSICEETQIWW